MRISGIQVLFVSAKKKGTNTYHEKTNDMVE